MGIVYILKNKINNKMYVGQTIQKFKKRFKHHLDNKDCKMVITRAIKKYGKHNFEKYLYYIPTNLLNYFEKELIKKLNTIIPNGYNVANGGNKGRIFHKSIRIKMSRAKKGKKLSKEHALKIKKLWENPKYRNHMSKAHKGKVPGNKGVFKVDRIIKNCKYCDYEMIILENSKRKFCNKKCLGGFHSGENNVSKRKDVRKKISIKGKGRINTNKGKMLVSRISSLCKNCGKKLFYRPKEKKKFCNFKCFGEYYSNIENEGVKKTRIKMSKAKSKKLISKELKIGK